MQPGGSHFILEFSVSLQTKLSTCRTPFSKVLNVTVVKADSNLTQQSPSLRSYMLTVTDSSDIIKIYNEFKDKQ